MYRTIESAIRGVPDKSRVAYHGKINSIDITVYDLVTDGAHHFKAIVDDGFDKIVHRFNSMKAVRYWVKSIANEARNLYE